MKSIFCVLISLSLIVIAVLGINCFYAYFFPIKFQSEISTVSAMYDIEEAVIYSIINVESRFDCDAISSKGAVGLMQVMPSTAQEVASSIDLDEYDLTSASDNILIGTLYFSKLLSRFENLQTALAAYNAGPTNVKNWLTNENYSDDGITLKEIPFEETKEYLIKFMRSYKYYSSKLLD